MGYLKGGTNHTTGAWHMATAHGSEAYNTSATIKEREQHS